MATSFTSLVDKLKKRTKFQKTPIPYLDSDYEDMIVGGIKTLYIDKGNEILFESEFNETTLEISVDYGISSQEYILNAAQISFYELIQQDVNTIVGYSTNSLTITNADKPYANISNEITRLQGRQVELFHKIIAKDGV